MTDFATVELRNREIKFVEPCIIGFIRLLRSNSRDPYTVCKEIAKSETKYAVHTIISSCQNISDDIYITALKCNQENPIILEEIYRMSKTVELEARPVSEESLVITTRDFLQRLNIEQDEIYLSDYFNNILVVDREDPSIILDEMTEDLQWTNTTGNSAWKALLERKKYRAYMVFLIDGNLNKVMVDLDPPGEPGPIIVDGTKEAQNHTKAFVQKMRDLKEVPK